MWFLIKIYIHHLAVSNMHVCDKSERRRGERNGMRIAGCILHFFFLSFARSAYFYELCAAWGIAAEFASRKVEILLGGRKLVWNTGHHHIWRGVFEITVRCAEERERAKRARRVSFAPAAARKGAHTHRVRERNSKEKNIRARVQKKQQLRTVLWTRQHRGGRIFCKQLHPFAKNQ